MRVEDQLSEEIGEILRDHPDLHLFAPLYVLALLVIKKDWGNYFFWLHSIFKYGYYGLFSPTVFKQFYESSSVDVKSLSIEEFRSVTEYFLSQARELVTGAIGTLPYRKLQYPYSLLPQAMENSPDAFVPRTKMNFADSEEFTQAIIAEFESDAFQLSIGEDTFDVYISECSDQAISILAIIQVLESASQRRENYSKDRQLIERLIDFAAIKPSEYIYNPVCGDGSLFVSIKDRYPIYSFVFTGSVQNAFDNILLGANAVAVLGDAYVFEEDLLRESAPPEGTESLAIAVLPHRERIGVRKPDPDFVRFGGRANRSEYAYIEIMLTAVNEQGRVVAAVSDHFLNSSEGRELRMHLVANDLLEMVHYVPRNAKIHGSFNAAVIVLNKAKAEPGRVTFDGDGEEFLSTQILTDNIVSPNYDLRPARYAHKGRAIVEQYSGSRFPMLELSHIVDRAISGRAVSTRDGKSDRTSDVIPFITISDLLEADTGADFIPKSASRRVARKGVEGAIDFSAILVGTLQGRLKPTYFAYNGTPIAIGNGIIALTPNGKVRAEYLLAQLQSNLVKVQVEMASHGNVIERISKSDLLQIKIPLPTVEEQSPIAFELLAATAEKADILEQVYEARVEAKLAEYDVVAGISHNLNQNLGGIVDDVNALMLFLERTAESGKVLDFGERMRPIRSNESPEDVETLSQVRDRIQRNLQYTVSTLKKIEGILQKQSVYLESTNIIKFFTDDIKKEFESLNVRITIESKKSGRLMLPLDRVAFKEALGNLIHNAKKHGFRDNGRQHEIVFSIDPRYFENGIEYVQIIYKNDGESFPKGFNFEDFKRLGKRSGKTKGTGIGGFFVARVIDLHNGKFNCVELDYDQTEKFPVQFEILLPLRKE